MAVEWASSWASDVRAENLTKAKTAAHGGSRLMQLAAILGAIADKFVDKVIDKAKEMDAAGGKGGNENTLTAEMQALTQIMKAFTEAMNTTIKTMGEGNSSVARKQ